MKELLESFSSISFTDVVDTIPLYFFIIAGIVGILAAYFYFYLVHYGYSKSMVFSFIVGSVALIVCFGIVMLLGYPSYDSDLRKDRLKEIVSVAIEQDIPLEITDKYIVFEGDAYKHNLDNIDLYVITDKDGNLIITDEDWFNN